MILAVLIIVPNLLIVAIAFLGKPSAPPPLPNPNGYDDFVKAGQLIKTSTNDYTKLSHDQLAAVVATNNDAWESLRNGLGHECRVSKPFSTNDAQTYMSFKQLGQLICARGRLAELEGRTNDAAGIYLDGVRFGQSCSRGGVLISRLVGIACERMALDRLQRIVSSLDATNSAAVARALEQINDSEEPIADTFATESLWVRKVYGFRGQIEALLEYKMLKKTRDNFTTHAQAVALQIRTEEMDFAARAYELEKGKRPQNITELVPGYLKAVPQNPATGKDMTLGP